MENKYTEDDVKKMVALYAYNWKTNIIQTQTAQEHKISIGELTPSHILKYNERWPMIEFDLEKLNKSFEKK